VSTPRKPSASGVLAAFEYEGVPCDSPGSKTMPPRNAVKPVCLPIIPMVRRASSTHPSGRPSGDHEQADRVRHVGSDRRGLARRVGNPSRGPRIAGRKLLIIGAVVDIIALSGIVLAQR
jgi:hypothetical protein